MSDSFESPESGPDDRPTDDVAPGDGDGRVDRDAILARRSALVRRALVGAGLSLVVAGGCEKDEQKRAHPEPCLSIAPAEETAGPTAPIETPDARSEGSRDPDEQTAPPELRAREDATGSTQPSDGTEGRSVTGDVDDSPEDSGSDPGESGDEEADTAEPDLDENDDTNTAEHAQPDVELIPQVCLSEAIDPERFE